MAAVLLPRPERVGEDGFAPLVATVQAAGAAALVEALAAEDVALARRLGLDGLHVEGDTALAAHCLAGRGDLIVGAGGLRSRHAAMEAAEAGVDYLLFGRLALADGFDAPHPRTLEEAAWWAETFETPAVVHGGGTLAALAEAVGTGAEFIAYGRAVLSHPDGPAAAVRTVEAALDAAAAGAGGPGAGDR